MKRKQKKKKKKEKEKEKEEKEEEKEDIDVEGYKELRIRGKKRREISRLFARDTFPQQGLVHQEKRHVSHVRTSSLRGHRYDDVDPFFSFSWLRLSRFIPPVSPYYSYHSQPMVIGDRRQLSNYRHLRLGAGKDPKITAFAGSWPRISIVRSIQHRVQISALFRTREIFLSFLNSFLFFSITLVVGQSEVS